MASSLTPPLASPLQASPLDAELASVRHTAGFTTAAGHAFLRVTGSDAARWLNGMVTNAAQALAPGAGNYNFLLNAQGRIQGDCLLFRDTAASEETTFLLATEPAQIDAIQAHLDRYIIMDDVELTPAFTDEDSLLLLGPDAPRHLAALDLPAPDPLHLVHADTPHGQGLLLALAPGLVPRFELRAAPGTIAALRDRLLAAGVLEVSATALEQLRLLEGTPRFGVDIRDRELPQETNQAQALHFAKGCYLGQEIVERIRSRGQVHRIFTALRLEGSLPPLPAALETGGKPAGEITSAAEVLLDDGPAQLALGYVRREALEIHAPLQYPGGTAHSRPVPRGK